MNISRWWGFNGGFLWKNDQIWINNIYMKIIGNGKWKCNLANLEQWLDISTILFSFHVQKNTTNKGEINIPVAYASSTCKINFDVTNALNNLWKMWVTSMKLYICIFSMSFVSIVMIWLSFFYFLFFVLYSFINFVFAKFYLCTLLKTND